MELGLFSFVETDIASGVSPRQRIAHLLEEIELADQVGLDVFGVGEHHRSDYVASAPAVVLAAAAAKTSRIRLTSSVSVLSSADPVRVFQDFSTLDLISGGRAEIMAGRGSFIESYPLFGFDLDDYDELFAERLDLLLNLREHEFVEWEGRTRPAIHGSGVYPRPVQSPLPVWIAVGGTPASVARAGTLGLPLAIAIIGGQPERFTPFADLHRRAAEQAGHARLPLSLNCHGFIARDRATALNIAAAPFLRTMNRIGTERGWSPMGRQGFEASSTLREANAVGSPEEIAEKILLQHEQFAHDRFLLQLTVGPILHADVMRAIELYGTEVAPLVRAEVARRG